MDHRRFVVRLLATVAVAALLGLPGCFGTDAATAQKHQGKASDNARSDWASDVELIGVFGVEGKGGEHWGRGPWGDHGEARSAEYFAKNGDDDDVGDGRAEVWAYGYYAPSKPDYVYIAFYDKGGDKMGDVRVPFVEKDFDQLEPIGAYELNSDEAVEAARQAEPDLDAALSAEDRYAGAFLIRTQDHPNAMWTVFAGTSGESGGASGFAVVDATTGEVLAHYGGSS